MTHVNFLHLASRLSKLLLKRKWRSSDPLEKPEYDFVPHLRKARGGLLLQSSFFELKTK